MKHMEKSIQYFDKDYTYLRAFNSGHRKWFDKDINRQNIQLDKEIPFLVGIKYPTALNFDRIWVLTPESLTYCKLIMPLKAMYMADFIRLAAYETDYDLVLDLIRL